jgi:Dolichyl-phosphate-mannose-protein mannosyltransferase
MTITHPPRTHRPPSRVRTPAHRAPGRRPAPPPGPARLAGEQLTVAGGQLAAGIGNLLFSLAAARVLAPGAFADLTAFLALYLLIHVPAASLSAGSALSPALAARLRRRVLKAGAVAGGALALLSVPLAALLDVSPLLLLAAALSAPTAGLIALDRGRLYGLGRHARAVGSLLAEPAVRLGAGIALAVVAGPVGGAFAVVAAGWAALAVAHLPGTAAAPGGAAATRPGAAVVAFLLLAVVQNQDVLFANAMLPEGEAARFAVLSTLGGIAAFATTTVPLMLLPRARAGGDAVAARPDAVRAGASPDALWVAVVVAALLGIAALLVVAVSPHALVGAIFGARYEAVGAHVVPYVLAMALLGVARVLVAHVCAAREPSFALGVLGAAAAVHVALLLALGDDAAGIAMATLITTTGLTAGAAAVVARPQLARTAASVRAFATRRDVALVAGLTAAGLVLRLLATRGIWLDEATSVKQASMPLGRMLDELGAVDVHPPLHHLVLWVTVRVLGTGELAVRLPSLLAATALIPLLFVIGRDVYDRRAGLAASSLATVAPFTVWYAQEARMYALFMLFALLAAWLQVRIVRDRRLRDCLAYVAAAVALIHTQYFGLLFVGAQQLVFLAALWARRRDAVALRTGLVAWGTLLPLLALACVPLMSFALGQFEANEAAGKGFQQVPSQTGGALEESQAPPGAYAALTNAAWALLGYHSDATMTALAALWPLLMLLALLLLGRGRSWSTGALATAAALPALMLFGLGQLKPFVFEVRYFVGAVPLLLLLVGRALTSWPARRGATALAGAAAFAALAAGLADQQLNGSNPRVYDFKGALTALEARARPGDVVVFTPPYIDTVVAYYGDGRLDARPLERGLPEPRAGRRVFVLASFLDKPVYRAAADDAVRELDREHRLVRLERHPQIRIWEFR